jgi:hypothetical protein
MRAGSSELDLGELAARLVGFAADPLERPVDQAAGDLRLDGLRVGQANVVERARGGPGFVRDPADALEDRHSRCDRAAGVELDVAERSLGEVGDDRKRLERLFQVIGADLRRRDASLELAGLRRQLEARAAELAGHPYAIPSRVAHAVSAAVRSSRLSDRIAASGQSGARSRSASKRTRETAQTRSFRGLMWWQRPARASSSSSASASVRVRP